MTELEKMEKAAIDSNQKNWTWKITSIMEGKVQIKCYLYAIYTYLLN